MIRIIELVTCITGRERERERERKKLNIAANARHIRSTLRKGFGPYSSWAVTFSWPTNTAMHGPISAYGDE